LKFIFFCPLKCLVVESRYWYPTEGKEVVSRADRFALYGEFALDFGADRAKYGNLPALDRKIQN
jgi:hypothetical protein